ncbi:GcrA family cell cycle regulator [Rhodovulum sp. DZ06]|uniref:GcrA family cell cycle regulator n=1 Tax=Rhodovulum sp. DZ06 TaxID=3425126 RepID=UPI003D34F601
MSWTDERVEALKAMWNEGKSASQIAKALGGVTRNAVIGKVHRLGLSNRTGARGAAKDAAAPAAEAPAPAAAPAPEPAAKAEEPPAAPARAAEPEPAPEPAPAPRAAPAPAAAAPSAPETTPPVPVGGTSAATHLSTEVPEEARRNLEAVEKKAKRISLLQLTERTCKWPMGDPATDDFFFCGLQSQPGKPYCEAHVAVAFQPMSARRDRSRSR